MKTPVICIVLPTMLASMQAGSCRMRTHSRQGLAPTVLAGIGEEGREFVGLFFPRVRRIVYHDVDDGNRVHPLRG